MISNVSTEDKLTVLQAHIGPIMDALGALAKDKTLSADDVVEVFAMGVAAILENDSHLTGARACKLASQQMGELIRQRLKDFRALSEVAGSSVLTLMRTGVPIGAYAQG